jgi:ParB family transcriptional regulator, chromosome partitioning protein
MVESSRTSRLQDVPVTELRSNPDQPRKSFSEGALAELAASIDRHGLIQPIVVVERDDGFTIVAGERRFRAIQSLGHGTIPALVITSGMTDELALVENIQREDLHPIEEAEAIQCLMDRHGYTHEAVAGIVGKARSTITNTLKLNQLPERIKQECMTSNLVSKSLLLEILGLPPERREKFWDRIKDGSFTVQKARARKEGTKRKSSPLGETVIRAGATFRSVLAALKYEGTAEPAQLDELRLIHRDIEELLSSMEGGISRDKGRSTSNT